MALPPIPPLTLLAAFALANTPAGPRSDDSARLAELERSIVEFQLPSGWRFLLVPRPGAPVVSIETMIDVGSVLDGNGSRGLANLLAHSLEQGSERLGSMDWSAERVALAALDEAHRKWLVATEEDDEEAAEDITRAATDLQVARMQARLLASPESFLRYLEDAGGASSVRAEVSVDWTRFNVTLPSNQIELWCWLEAERFTRPCLRGFFDERERQLEARGRELESDPLATLLGQLRQSALTTHPYRHPVGGYIEDLERLGKGAAEDFFRAHYGADRLVTTIIGDIQPDALKPMLARYLGPVPAGSRAPRERVQPTSEPAPSLERRIAVAYGAPPRMAIAWPAPQRDHADTAAIEVAARILGPDPGSRLHERLVRRDAMAADLEVHTGWPGGQLENLVLVTLTPLAGVEITAIETAVEEELAQLRGAGPSAAELEAWKRVMRTDLEETALDAKQLAHLLCRAEMAKSHDTAAEGADDRDGWRAALRRTGLWDAVDTEAVQAVTDVYFTEVERTVAVLEPNEAAPRPLWSGPSEDPEDSQNAQEIRNLGDAGGSEEPRRAGGGRTESQAGDGR